MQSCKRNPSYKGIEIRVRGSTIDSRYGVAKEIPAIRELKSCNVVFLKFDPRVAKEIPAIRELKYITAIRPIAKIHVAKEIPAIREVKYMRLID